MNDTELLALVASERARSIGFDHDGTLSGEREKALQYIKGEMPDVPALPNRSKAVSHDISDAIETILPDLVEIFTGGDDVAVFVPRGAEDEDAAQQETDYVNHVIFNENDGWLAITSMMKDALQVKTGVVKWAWEDGEELEERLEGKSAVAIGMAQQDGEIIDLTPCEPEEGEEYAEPLFDCTVRKKRRGRVEVMAVPPEDFTVASDTVRLPKATYCAMRSRPRAQDLLAQGISEEMVSQLTPYGSADNAVEAARDTAGEHNEAIGESLLRRVEVVEHYIRVYDGKPKLWRLLTGKNESLLLEKEEVDAIPFAAITPYIVTHRFYGESVADRLMEIQRINTALTRIALDSAYFALTQRLYVDENAMTANTIPDLLRNEPGVPIRGKGANGVTPIQSGSLNFDVFGALEYFQTKSEQRTGIVRNAQGLNPDTLHDTASGALALMTAAQKRIRLIARIFAETGIKDLFLGVHALLRKHADQKATVRLRNKWTEIDPTSWGERADMSIEIGLGSSGKEQEIAELTKMVELTEKLIMAQGGQPGGPLISLDNLYNLARRCYEKLGAKAPEKYLSDPKDAQPQEQGPPPPDPKLVEVQAKAQLEQQKAQAAMQMDAEKQQHEQEKAVAEFQHRQAMDTAGLDLKREIAAAELDMKERLLVSELGLKREIAAAELSLKQQQAEHAASMREQEVSSDIGNVETGGEPG